MKLGKKTAWLLKILFLCVISIGLAFGFNVVRPKPFTSFSELTAQQVEDIVEIGTPEMVKAYDSGVVIIIDARSDMDFAMGHIPGSISIPSWAIGDELTAMTSQIKRGKSIIVYCDGLSCGKSLIVAKKLLEKGFKGISIYTEGIDGWLGAGRDLEAN